MVMRIVPDGELHLREAVDCWLHQDCAQNDILVHKGKIQMRDMYDINLFYILDVL